MARKLTDAKGVIFDNDDTAQAHDPKKGYGSPEDQYYAAFLAIAACFGMYFAKDSELRMKVMGIDIKDVGRIMIEELGLPITYDQWKSALDSILLTLAPFAELAPGFESSVRHLQARGLKVGIASSAIDVVLAAKWARFPELRSRMQCFVAGNQVKRSKPEPELLLLAALHLELRPEECVYIGDSKSDMTAAMNAGMQAIFFRHKNRTVAGIPPGVHAIESMAELESIF